jgi:hypothetical protein
VGNDGGEAHCPSNAWFLCKDRTFPLLSSPRSDLRHLPINDVIIKCQPDQKYLMGEPGDVLGVGERAGSETEELKVLSPRQTPQDRLYPVGGYPFGASLDTDYKDSAVNIRRGSVPRV